jgi:hypothetical protein
MVGFSPTAQMSEGHIEAKGQGVNRLKNVMIL